MTKTLLCIFLIFALQPIPGNASELREVVSTGPSWDSFTNRDGTGLYHEVLREVFSLYGISVRHEYMPTDRGDEMVRTGQGDMMTCDDRAQPPLVTGRYPMFTNDFHVFFKKSRIPDWTGPESLRDREVASQLGYYHDWDFPVPVRIREMPSGVKCLNMVLLGRSDFYVDDISFIENSIRLTDQVFDREEYAIRRAGSRSYFPLFNKTPRGKKVKQMYEAGMMILHKAGKLKPIFDKWGHKYPDFDSF